MSRTLAPKKAPPSDSAPGAGAGAASGSSLGAKANVLVTPSPSPAPATPKSRQQQDEQSLAFSPASPPQTPASAAATTVARITAHMNLDHADSLTRYLEHFGRVPSIATHSPQMTGFSEDSMTITSAFMPNPFSNLLARYFPPAPAASSSAPEKDKASGADSVAAATLSRQQQLLSTRTTTIPFTPALPSLGSARARLIEMDNAALAALGRSRESIKRYSPPSDNALHAAWSAFVAFAWVLFFPPLRNVLLSPYGGLVETLLKAVLPASMQHTAIESAAFLWRVQPLILGVIVVLHVGEAAWMGAVVLRRHTVSVGSGVWCAWVASTLFEGFPVWSRLASVVKEERVRREKTMH